VGHSIPKPSLSDQIVTNNGNISMALAILLGSGILVTLLTSNQHISLTIIVVLCIGAAVIFAVPTSWYIMQYRRRPIGALRREVGSLVDNVISDVLTQSEDPAVSEDLQAEVMSQLADLARVRPGPLSQWVAMPPSVRRGASSCRKHVAARKFYLCWQGRGPVHG
jgi:hypothetical protein